MKKAWSALVAFVVVREEEEVMAVQGYASVRGYGSENYLLTGS